MPGWAAGTSSTLQVLRGCTSLAQAGQRPWVSPGLGTASEGTCAILPLLSWWVWLCPTSPSLGWGYSGTLLLLSSFSPAASRNRAVCAAAAAPGAGGSHPLLSGCATPPVPLQMRCFISSRCTLSAPATSTEKETPPPPGMRCWGLPGLGKSPSDVQLKKAGQGCFLGHKYGQRWSSWRGPRECLGTRAELYA